MSYCIIEIREGKDPSQYTYGGMNYLYVDKNNEEKYEISIMRKYEAGHKPKVFDSEAAARDFIKNYVDGNKLGAWHVVELTDILIDIAEQKLRQL